MATDREIANAARRLWTAKQKECAAFFALEEAAGSNLDGCRSGYALIIKELTSARNAFNKLMDADSNAPR